jgi:hypothetical protein
MTTLPSRDATSFQHLLHATGRDARLFLAELQPDGLVRVRGPRGTAFYPREGWLSRFERHLERSFFDPQLPQPAAPTLRRKAAGMPAA